MDKTDKSFLVSDFHRSSWFKPGNWQELLLAGAALHLGLFEQLASGPMTADKLSSQLQLDRRALEITLDALQSLGYLNKSEDAFSLTGPAKRRFGDKSSPDYVGWSILHSWRLVQRWSTLPDVLKTGQPLPGDRFLETVEGFIRAMDVYSGPTAQEVVAVCLEAAPKADTVLDIGGATGTASKIFAERGLKVTLFDIPDVIEVIQDEMASSHPNITLDGGDFNQSIPTGPFDIIFLGNVTHIYGPSKNQALYRRVHQQLASSGLIAIQDYVQDLSSSAPLFAVNMLVNTTTGGTWTKVQYSDWLAAAGFAKPKFIDLGTRDQQLVLAAALK